MSNSGNGLIRYWQDGVLLVGLVSILAVLGYGIATAPWEDPIGMVIIGGIVAAVTIAPFSPWIRMLIGRWRE